MLAPSARVVSELRKPLPHGAVLAWLVGVEDANLHLATVTLGEIQAGIELTRKQDLGKASENEVWLDLVSLGYNVFSDGWTSLSLMGPAKVSPG